MSSLPDLYDRFGANPSEQMQSRGLAGEKLVRGADATRWVAHRNRGRRAPGDTVAVKCFARPRTARAQAQASCARREARAPAMAGAKRVVSGAVVPRPRAGT